MNPVHLHLMLTHVPVVGTVFALLLLGFALFRRSSEMMKAAFFALAISAAVAIPVYLTGEPAEHAAEALPGVTEAIIEPHEDAAKVAFALILAAGAVACGGLASLRRKAVPQWFAVSVLGLTLLATGALTYTAGLGGKVRHTEIRAEGQNTLPTLSRDRD